MLGSKTLVTKCIRTLLCIMLANHDQNIESRLGLLKVCLLVKLESSDSEFTGLNLQGLIDRTSCRLIFLQNFQLSLSLFDV